MRILGIDPGLTHTGFGVIELNNKTINYLASGVINTVNDRAMSVRLKIIFEGINEIISEYKPNYASIEKVFVNVNPKTTLLLGQARGCAITACAINDITVNEYSALQIKKSVVGYGHAQKNQMVYMVQNLLKLNGTIRADAADALAAAITHAYHLLAPNALIASQ
jgi:crossover junction endodeoxyribonuclease RuvC